MRYILQISGARPKTALVMSTQEWNNLKIKTEEGRRQNELKEERNLQKELKREQSRKMTENWPNTLASMQRQRERQLIVVAQKAEDEKLKEYNEILQKREIDKQQIIDKAKKLLYERSESCRRVTSGLVLSAILEERGKQIAMKKAKSEQQSAEQLAEAIDRRKMADDYHREMEQRKLKHWVELQRNRQFLDEQMVEVLKKRHYQMEEKIREKEDLDLIRKELDEEKEQEKQKLAGKKKKLKEEQERWAAVGAEYKNLCHQQNQEEEQLIAIYQAVRDRMNYQRAQMEKKQREEVIERRANIPAHFLPQPVDLKEEETLQKKTLEKQAKQIEREQVEKKERLRLELKVYEAEAKKLAEIEANRKKELHRYEMLQRLALEKADRSWRRTQEEKKRQNQKAVRQALYTQWEEREKKEREGRWEDITVYEKARMEEQDFLLRYCAEIENANTQSGRPMYPILAAIESVKKSAGLRQEKKKIPFLQSRVPIRSVALYGSI